MRGRQTLWQLSYILCPTAYSFRTTMCMKSNWFSSWAFFSSDSRSTWKKPHEPIDSDHGAELRAECQHLNQHCGQQLEKPKPLSWGCILMRKLLGKATRLWAYPGKDSEFSRKWRILRHWWGPDTSKVIALLQAKWQKGNREYVGLD